MIISGSWNVELCRRKPLFRYLTTIGPCFLLLLASRSFLSRCSGADPTVVGRPLALPLPAPCGVQFALVIAALQVNRIGNADWVTVW